MHPVLVTLTTIPSRAPLLWPVLDSLLHRQTVPPAAVIVNLPRAYAAALGSLDAAPAEWQSRGKVPLVINRDCADLGPATKLVGAAKLIARHRGALVLYLDDDHVPNRYLVQAHALAHSRAAAPMVWCGRGEIVESVRPFRRTIVTQRDPSRRVHVPSGVGSVSVGVAHLRVAALAAKVARGSPLARMADDIVFADWFARHRLPVATLGQDHLLEVQPHATDDWALHLCRRPDCDAAPDARYSAVIAELDAAFGPLEPLRPPSRPARSRSRRARVKMWNGSR